MIQMFIKLMYEVCMFEVRWILVACLYHPERWPKYIGDDYHFMEGEQNKINGDGMVIIIKIVQENFNREN